MHFVLLLQIADASVMDLDCWRLRLTLPDSSYQPAKTYAMAQVVGDEAAAVKGSQVLMEGVFYNYFSVGADAQAAYNFHHLRDEHPMLASNRLANQFWYSTFSCTSGVHQRQHLRPSLNPPLAGGHQYLQRRL
jgi:diacylglycerol kinase (ATP)